MTFLAPLKNAALLWYAKQMLASYQEMHDRVDSLNEDWAQLRDAYLRLTDFATNEMYIRGSKGRFRRVTEDDIRHMEIDHEMAKKDEVL